MNQVYPLYSPDITLTTDLLPKDIYIKRLKLLRYKSDAKIEQHIFSIMMREIQICEILKKNPHPNVTEYLRCVIEDNLVKGLVFKKYVQTIVERLKEGKSKDGDVIDLDRCTTG